MKRILLSMSVFALTIPCVAELQAAASDDAEIAGAKAAIKQFAGALQTELKTAMQAGGPVAAIGVCNTQAMPITAQVGAEHGMQLSRVSVKNRNPANAPNDWQAAVLESFEQQNSAGKDIAKLSWSETVSVGGAQEFRFMKAIPTGAVCLKCHGTQLTPEITAALAGMYPQDRATGYSEGDIRGAFVVTRSLEAPSH